MSSTLRLNSGPLTSSALPKYLLDPLLDGASGGVLSLFDLAYLYSYAGAPTASPPVNGQAIRNIAQTLAGGAVNLSGSAPSYAGGGFDFTGLSAPTATVEMPSSIAEHIAAQTNGYFLLCAYVKLPSQTDWVTASGQQPIFCFTTNSSGFAGETDLVTVALLGTGSVTRLRATRTYTGGSVVTTDLTVSSSHYGQVCQVAFYRTAAGVALRVQSANGSQIQTGVVGTKSGQDVTGKKWRLGIGPSFYSANFTNAHRWRLYRGWAEDLEASGRDPATVLTADWTRTAARGVFS